MKKTLLSILAAATILSSSCYVQRNAGNDVNTQTIEVPQIEVSSMNNDSLRNLYSDTEQIGVGIDVFFNLKNSGRWHTERNGDRTWYLRIVSPEASYVALLFENLHIPLSATLTFYADNTNNPISDYSYTDNTKDGKNISFPIPGESVTLKYHEPRMVKDEGIVYINKVVHGFRSLVQELAMHDTL